MEVKMEYAAPDFRPITLTIKIESHAEHQMLLAMTALDEDIPQAVEREAGAKAAYETCQRFLKYVRMVLPR